MKLPLVKSYHHHCHQSARRAFLVAGTKQALVRSMLASAKNSRSFKKKLRCDDVIRVLLAEMSDVGSNLGRPDFYGL